MLTQEVIERTVVSQQETFARKERIILRELAAEIRLQNKFAIIISWVRRSGKSTLMKIIAQKISSFYHISFEDPRLSGFDLSDFERLETVFRNVYGVADHYFFDEIQLVDRWEFHIRRLLDQNKFIVITGSNASLLSKELGTKLTGRNLRYELFPFSYAEFLLFTGNKAGVGSFNEYLVHGGFPEYLLLRDPRILRDLLADSLSRDIAVRHKIKNVRQLNEFAVFLISNVSKEFSYNNLRKLFNFGSTNSVSKFISFMEESYLLFTLPRFDYSLRKQLVNPKKVYAIDNGLVVQNSRTFQDDLGRLLENAVFVSLKSRKKELFYFRETKECDFVVREGQKITHAYQVCYSLDESNKEREIGGLVEALARFNLKEGIIITLAQEDEFRVEGRKIRVMPAWKWMMP